jgi:type IV secretory pathway component VirB8
MDTMPSLLRRPATAGEIEQAAEIIIPKAELDRLYQQAQARRGKQAGRSRRWEIGKTAVILGQFGVIGALGFGCAVLATQYRIETIYVYQRDDGTVTNSMDWSSLPDAVKANSALNTLWQYVWLRESYSSGTAQHAWNVVSALSSPDVRKEYQAWAGADNPRSPRRLYGERDRVDVEFVSVSPVCTRDPCNEATTDTYQVRFNRSERVAGVSGKPELWSVILRYRRLSDEARKKLPWWQVAQFNNPGIQVWEYPGAHPEGIAGHSAFAPQPAATTPAPGGVPLRNVPNPETAR